jgi:short-subunit dehydrogenase
LSGRSEASLASTKGDLEKKYPNVQFLTVAVDLASPESVDELFKSLKNKIDKLGDYHSLLHNSVSFA